MSYYQLHALSSSEFEELVTQLCHELLGLGTSRFASGPDGGRDAFFEGTAEHYPSDRAPWSGKFVIQAKHTERADVSCSDRDFVRMLLEGSQDRKSEAAKIAKRRHEGQCDCYLLFTNRRLPALQEEKLRGEFREKTGVPKVGILGREAISDFLDRASHVAHRFGLQKAIHPRAHFQVPPPKRDFTGRVEELK